MPDPLESFDLRLTPDWLKESETANRYSQYEGSESENSLRQRRDRERPRRPTNERAGRDLRDRRQTTSRPGSSAPQSRTNRPGDRSIRPADRPPRALDRPPIRRDAPPAPTEQVEPAAVQVDFLPEERAFAKIIQQIKQGHAAYPLFGLARMFLERPERHRVRVRSLDNQRMLFQLGDDGPVALESAALERIAFNEKREEFYLVETIQREPLKGNFTSVARCSLSGRLLGPTNYHTFQKSIRALYEQRFSRRMSFEEYRRMVEITSDTQAVEQWKEEARRAVSYRTKSEEGAEVFDNLGAVEQHFRTHYLTSVIKPCLAAEISGDLVRHIPDRSIVASVRNARDRENRFPARMAGALRHGLNQAGLHVFKHKKRILYISTVRPQVFESNEASISPGLGAILTTLRSFPKITRKQLAEKVVAKLLGTRASDENSPEYRQVRASLASDLLWLAKVGHVIEFADGTLDLPLPPKETIARGGTGEESLSEEPSDDTSSSSLPSAAVDAEKYLTPVPAASTTDPSAGYSLAHQSAVSPENSPTRRVGPELYQDAQSVDADSGPVAAPVSTPFEETHSVNESAVSLEQVTAENREPECSGEDTSEISPEESKRFFLASSPMDRPAEASLPHQPGVNPRDAGQSNAKIDTANARNEYVAANP